MEVCLRIIISTNRNKQIPPSLPCRSDDSGLSKPSLRESEMSKRFRRSAESVPLHEMCKVDGVVRSPSEDLLINLRSVHADSENVRAQQCF